MDYERWDPTNGLEGCGRAYSRGVKPGSVGSTPPGMSLSVPPSLLYSLQYWEVHGRVAAQGRRVG